MMIRTFLLSMLFAASQLVAAQTIYKSDDKFSGDTRFFTEERTPDLEGGSFFSMRYVYFSSHAFKKAANARRPYAILISSSTPDWVFIRSGESLILKLDGTEMLPLSGDGSMKSRSIVSSGSVREAATYTLSQTEIERIGKAKSVEFRILGDRQTITGTWQPEMIADAAFFAAKGPGLLGIDPAAAKTTSGSAGAEPQRFGVQFVAVTQPLADSLRMPAANGVMIVAITPGSIADKSGLRQGDVVLRFGDRTTSTTEDLQSSVSGVASGVKVPVRIWRNGTESDMEAQF